MTSEKCCESVDIKERIKKFYGERWESEGSTCTCETSKSKERSPRYALISELSPRRGMKVLDVGCGTGDTVLKIAEEVGPNGKVVGVDFSPEGIAQAKKKALSHGLEKVTEFRVADAETLPFEDNFFDAVISECVVCLIPDKQRVLNEKVRVLKPGGRVIMHDVISRIRMPKTVREDPKLYCGCIGGAVSEQDYLEMMRRAGLTDTKVVDYSEEARKGLNAMILSAAVDTIKNDKDFHEVVDFVRKGGIGYALFMGKKAVK